jgi:hypothetical protein
MGHCYAAASATDSSLHAPGSADGCAAGIVCLACLQVLQVAAAHVHPKVSIAHLSDSFAERIGEQACAVWV